jgi:hypothetical protein
MDLLMTIAAVLCIDFLRGLFVRYCNTWWFWNLEFGFVSVYGRFLTAIRISARLWRVQSRRERSAFGKQPRNDLAWFVLRTDASGDQQRQVDHSHVHSRLGSDDLQCSGTPNLSSIQVLEQLCI